MEMNFCRRCGTELINQNGHVYKCENGHTVYANASPAVGLLIVNDKKEVLLLERALNPEKGKLDAPGGFCDGAETVEDAVYRETQEEVGFAPQDYTMPQFILSGIDPYTFEGEGGVVLCIMFSAKLARDTVPRAADDAASAQFVPLKDINLDDVAFPSVRAALSLLQQHP